MVVKNQIIIEGAEEEMHKIYEKFKVQTTPLSNDACELLHKIDSQDEFDAVITLKNKLPAQIFLED